MGAPIGNQNKVKGKKWQDALKRALSRKGESLSKGLDLVADQVVIAAINGDQWAIKEIGERMDGKAAQQQIITGDEAGGPISHSLSITFVDTDS
jgi:hypothetical protein